ncbi:sirohydrochlorin cobaltochelatase [Candidatus Methanoplasma termitum]|uniref:CbiX3 protein n=2 Tax=Candidatus Methanoplasma termitum TaxID=1577791 RepID=A0A0A7LGS0_9ARCH|nr:sirohydrochlorin cobaltochelatase [Candidatus Methanoplasma termitum]MCL2333330.1 sirohydrochlorin cobaltochelatase [Candidatus Methanoplasma sp.]
MKKGIMIIGHGSRYNYNKWVMEEQKKRLEGKGFRNVYIGFNETTYPLVEDVLEDMVKDGIDHVVAIPFFIACGLHIMRDIPEKLGMPHGANKASVKKKGKNIFIELW